MSQQKIDQFDAWYSTYGLLTIERVLALLQIRTTQEEIIEILKQSNHILTQVLHLPMLNIFNGIIFQQAYDYQIYAQKLMIDYRLSPEYAKTSESPGANIRKDLEDQFSQLSSFVKSMTHDQYQHYHIISESQTFLIKAIEKVGDSIKEIELLDNEDTFKETMKQFYSQAQEMSHIFRNYRNQFYSLILNMTDRLASLPDYQFNSEQAARERESLFFDREIGE